MILGHGAIGQFGVAEALSGLVVNAGTVDVSMGQAATFSTGSESVTGSASFAVTTAGVGTFSLGTEVATGGANVSPTTAGAITTTIPSTSGQAIARVGEPGTTSIFSIRIDPPVRLD